MGPCFEGHLVLQTELLPLRRGVVWYCRKTLAAEQTEGGGIRTRIWIAQQPDESPNTAASGLNSGRWEMEDLGGLLVSVNNQGAPGSVRDS